MDKELIDQSLKELTRSANGDGSKEFTIDEFSVVWFKLCAAYPKNETTTLTIEVYFERLSAYEKEPILEAIGECLDQCKWFPAISEIVERIKSPRGCVHRLALAEIASKRAMLEASEKYGDRRLKVVADQIAELESRRLELYERDKELIEQSGIKEAQAKLEAVNSKIREQESALAILRQKVKLFDQARILQADH